MSQAIRPRTKNITLRLTTALVRASAIAFAVTACAPDNPPTAPLGPVLDGSVAADRLVRGSKFQRPDEERFVALAREIPGFAGYYLDSQHNIVAYVRDTVQFKVAHAALGKHLSSDRLGLPPGLQTGEILIRKGDYTFQELSDWRDLVTERVLGSVAGVLYDDLDEAINRVTIGVLKDNSPSIRAQVVVILSALGVPISAIHFEESGKLVPVTSATALNATTDTIAAGFELDLNTPGPTCSIGMILDRNGSRYASTASHCGSRMFLLDAGDQWYQVYSRYIGNEAWDTSATSGARKSDVELIRLQDSVPSIRGAIGRTTPRVNGASASRQSDTNHPFVFMFATGSPTVGVQVDKEGRTTGWTTGTITSSCQDVTVNGYTVLCEIKTSVWVGQGDSGSSLWHWDNYDGATLYGAALSLVQPDHFETIDGYNVAVGGVSWFASYPQFVSDIGAAGLNVVTGTALGSVNISGSLSLQNPVVTWTPPTVTNGRSSDTHYSLYRTTFVSGQYTEQDNLLTTYYSGTQWLDYTTTVTSYNGTSNPGPRFNWVSYYVVAYNGGVSRTSSTIYFKKP